MVVVVAVAVTVAVTVAEPMITTYGIIVSHEHLLLLTTRGVAFLI